MSLAENLDIKLCTLREDFDQTVACLKEEISELKSDLCEKQAKIQALESELATFKGNCKSSLENTKAKLESCEVELNKNEENIAFANCFHVLLSKDLEKLRKETKEIGKVKSISKNPLARTIENPSFESNKILYAEAANTILSIGEIKTKETNKAKSISENPLATTIEILSSVSNAKPNANTDQSNKPLVNTEQNVNPGKQSERSIIQNKETNDKANAETPAIDKTATGDNLNEQESSDFVGVQRKIIKRLYLGGVRLGTSIEKIKEYMKQKGISPTFIRIFNSKRKGTIAVRVNVNEEDFDCVCNNDFWPNHVYARQWLSKQSWEKRGVLHNQNTSQQN